MNPWEKQLVLNDGRTLYEHAKTPLPLELNEKGKLVKSALDCSRLNIGEPAPPPIRVSAEEFEATMRKIRENRKGG
jgi:hypothetical protein